MSDDDLAPKLMTLRVLWLSFLASVFIISGVFWKLVLERDPSEFDADPLVPGVLCGVGLLMPIGGAIFTRYMRGQLVGKVPGTDMTRVFATFQTNFILGLAFHEAAVIQGCVALHLSGNGLFWAPPTGLGLALLLLSFPTMGQIEAWRDRLL